LKENDKELLDFNDSDTGSETDDDQEEDDGDGNDDDDDDDDDDGVDHDEEGAVKNRKEDKKTKKVGIFT